MRLKGRPSEYFGAHCAATRGAQGLRVQSDENKFSFRVELPPKHELEESGSRKALRCRSAIRRASIVRKIYQLVEPRNARRSFAIGSSLVCC